MSVTIIYAQIIVTTVDTKSHLNTVTMKKCSERRKHSMLAVSKVIKKFCPVADSLPGGTGRPKFNHLEMVTTFTYKPSFVRIDARNLELSW